MVNILKDGFFSAAGLVHVTALSSSRWFCSFTLLILMVASQGSSWMWCQIWGQVSWKSSKSGERWAFNVLGTKFHSQTRLLIRWRALLILCLAFHRVSYFHLFMTHWPRWTIVTKCSWVLGLYQDIKYQDVARPHKTASVNTQNPSWRHNSAPCCL